MHEGKTIAQGPILLDRNDSFGYPKLVVGSSSTVRFRMDSLFAAAPSDSISFRSVLTGLSVAKYRGEGNAATLVQAGALERYYDEGTFGDVSWNVVFVAGATSTVRVMEVGTLRVIASRNNKEVISDPYKVVVLNPSIKPRLSVENYFPKYLRQPAATV